MIQATSSDRTSAGGVAGPLAPYRVLDLTGSCGQLGARLLADLGADVVKVEPPGGSPARLEGPYYHDDPRGDRSLSWMFFNANKRGVTLDLQRSEGRRLFCRLLQSFDIVFESFPPGVLAGLGLDYDALAAANERLIMVSITPFGSTGPYAHFKGSDIVAWAMGGKMYLDGDDDRAPLRVGVPQASSHAGAHAAVGALTALYQRGVSGRGQHVDVSVQESVAWTLMYAPQFWDVGHRNLSRGGAIQPSLVPGPSGPLRTRVIWRCKDGYVLFTVSGGPRAKRAVELLEREGLAGHLAGINWLEWNLRQVTQADYDRVAEVYVRFFAGKTKAQLVEIALREGIWVAPVSDAAEVVESPQLAARGFWQSLHHPDLDETVTYPGSSVNAADGFWTLRRPAPLLGEHNAEVYGELGLSTANLRALRESGVL